MRYLVAKKFIKATLTEKTIAILINECFVLH